MIDPRQVPVVSQVEMLPPVAGAALHPHALRQRFSKPPDWEPELVREKTFGDREPMQAAVLMAVVMHPEPTLLLTHRATHLATHSVKVAFPG